MWNIKKLELRRIRTQATQQLASGHGSCGGGKRNQTRELEFPKTRTKEARQQRTTGLGSCKDGKREQSRVLQLPKTQINAARQQEAIGLGSGKMLGGGEREDQQESSMKRIHEGKRASVVAMEAESITRDERSRSRSMSSKRTDAEFEKLVKEDEEQK